MYLFICWGFKEKTSQCFLANKCLNFLLTFVLTQTTRARVASARTSKVYRCCRFRCCACIGLHDCCVLYCVVCCSLCVLHGCVARLCVSSLCLCRGRCWGGAYTSALAVWQNPQHTSLCIVR